MVNKKTKKRLEAAVDALESFIEAAQKAKLFRDECEPVTETSPKLMRKLLTEPAPSKFATGGHVDGSGFFVPSILDHGYAIPEQFDPAIHLWGVDAAWEGPDYPRPMLIEHSPASVNITYLPIPKD
jgi:hypothetical protein